MKVGLLLEGHTDGLAFRILVGRLLGGPVEFLEYQRRASGSTGVLESVKRACWYEPVTGCRTCMLAAGVPPLPEPPLRVAIAVPVQMLEAWLLAARGVSDPESVPRRTLKRRAYGADHPTPAVVDRIVPAFLGACDLDALGRIAPSFARFAAQVRGWRS